MGKDTITLPEGFVLEQEPQVPEGFVMEGELPKLQPTAFEELYPEPIFTPRERDNAFIRETSRFLGGEKIENLLPLEERYRIGQVIGLADKPKEEEDRLANMFYLSVQYDKDPVVIDQVLDELVEQKFGMKGLSQAEVRKRLLGELEQQRRENYATELKPFSLFGNALLQSLAGKPAMALRGYKIWTPGQMWGFDTILQKTSDYLESLKNPTIKSELEIARNKKMWPTYIGQKWYDIQPNLLPEAINTWAAVVGDQVPLMLMTQASRMASKAVGQPIGLAVGSLWAMVTGGPEPTDLATAPVIAKITSKVIEHVGGAAPLVGVEGADYMDRANELGIDPDIAEKYARWYSLGSGAIEYAQWLWNLKAFKRLSPKVRRTLLKRVLVEIGGATWEGFEELSQQGLQNKLIQKAIDEQKGRNPDYDVEKPETWAEGKRSFAIGAGVSLITRMPGHAFNSVRKSKMVKKIQKATDATKEEATIAVEIMAEGGTNAEAAKEVIAEQIKAKQAEEAKQAEIKAEKPPVSPTETKTPVEPTKIAPQAEIERPAGEPAPSAEKQAEVAEETGLTTEEQVDIAKLETVELPDNQRIKLAEKIESVKHRIRTVTGQTKIGKFIQEETALKSTMKKAAQAARKAFSEGKKEGVEKQKIHYETIKAEAKERKQIREKIRKLAKRIAKPPSPAIDFFYREAIENLQAGIDPSFRTPKTLRQRQKTKEFLERKPEALKDIPVKLLKKLNQKTVADYTIGELEELSGEIEKLRQQGKLKRRLRLKQEAREIEATTDQITKNIAKGKPIKIEKRPVVLSTTKEGLIKTSESKSRAWTLRPSRIFDMLDGGKATFSGIAHKTFIDQVNRATDKKLRMEDKRTDAGKAKMKELGISFWDLSRTREIEGVKYIVDEMIGIYNANKNPSAKLAIMYGNNISEKTIEKVIANLSESEKAWGDYIVQDYDNNYDRLRSAVIEVENRDMGYEENYTPIRRTEIDYTTNTQEIVDAILRKESLRKAYAEHGFTVKRKAVPAEFQKPIRLSATSMWLGQVPKQEQYINLAKLVKDLHKIADNKNFRLVVEQKFGKEYNRTIGDYIDRVANPNIYKSYNWLENGSRRLRQNAVIAYLAYNLLTMAKQVPSLLLYLQDAGPIHLLSSAMQFAKHPLKMINEVREKDPQVKHKAIERELEELKAKQSSLYGQIVSTYGKAGMEGIYLFDAVARTIGWNAVYQKSLKNGMSEAEAIREAQNSTLRTQPAAAAKDLARLYATNEFANWFTMFTNQLNQIYNIATYDFSGYIKNKEYQKAALTFTGLSLSALAIWIISHRKFPETPEELADAGIEQAINATPLIGKAMMAGKKGWGEKGIPAFELPRQASRTTNRIIKGKATAKDLDHIAEGVAVTVGMPYIGPKRVIKTVQTGEPLELIGGQKEKKTKRISIKE